MRLVSLFLRIAYSTSSWGIQEGEKVRPSRPTCITTHASRRVFFLTGCAAQVLFHDLLSVDSSEANLIKDADKAYSKGSRIASEM